MIHACKKFVPGYEFQRLKERCARASRKEGSFKVGCLEGFMKSG